MLRLSVFGIAFYQAKVFEINGAVQQISYERSSQAQSLTCPPILLSATGYVDIRRMAFQVI
jgi:hypothetical protein